VPQKKINPNINGWQGKGPGQHLHSNVSGSRSNMKRYILNPPNGGWTSIKMVREYIEFLIIPKEGHTEIGKVAADQIYNAKKNGHHEY